MNFVQLIRDPEQIQQLKEYFKEKSLRNYILFIMKINTYENLGHFEIEGRRC